RLLPGVGPGLARGGLDARLARRVGARRARPGRLPAQARRPGRRPAPPHARARRPGRLREVRVSGGGHTPTELMIVAAARALAGGAQVAPFGSLNTTVIGDYERPRVRLPGSGGAAEIAINARRVFHVLRLSRRSFVERLDFVTSPGRGVRGGGPELVVTDLA